MRRASIAAFALVTIVALGYTPLQSAGSLRDAVSCEVSAPWHAWWIGINNARHITSYGLLCLLATGCYSTHRLAKAAGSVLVISLLVEIEQAFFAHGHCRIRDMLPNLVSIGIAALVWIGATRVSRRKSS